jgi:hypothetical protein
MLLNLEPPPNYTRTTGRVLAIESNPFRARMLEDLLRDHLRVDLKSSTRSMTPFDRFGRGFPTW